MIFKKLKDNNIVCACTDVKVKEVLLNIQKNLNFNNMTFIKLPLRERRGFLTE